MTELDAVNYLLDVLGSPPVGDFDSLHPDLATCRQKLALSSLFTQQNGLWFNTRPNIVFSQDADGIITLPHNTINVEGIRPFVVHEVEGRATAKQLFDVDNDTYLFTGPVSLDLTVQQDWNYLPLSAQNTIMYHAAMQVASIDLEDAQKASEQRNLYGQALMYMKSDNIRLRRRNQINTPFGNKMLGRARGRSFNPLFPGG